MLHAMRRARCAAAWSLPMSVNLHMHVHTVPTSEKPAGALIHPPNIRLQAIDEPRLAGIIMLLGFPMQLHMSGNQMQHEWAS